MIQDKMTSKTGSLKSLLVRAWRERWSDMQWGIHIKTVLPRGTLNFIFKNTLEKKQTYNAFENLASYFFRMLW